MKKITFKTIKLTLSFVLLFTLCATIQAQNFTSGSQVGNTGEWFYNQMAKDLNGDGYDDIISIDNGSNLVTYLSNGSGGFGAKNTLDGSRWIFNADDLDGDGDIDIVASSNQSNTPGFYIYKNNGSGSFTLQSSTPTNITLSGYTVLSQVQDLVIFDANGDGKKDIVLIPYISTNGFQYNDNTKQFLFLNTTANSTISFSQNAIINTNNHCSHGFAGDIDNDGDQDLVLDAGSSNGTEVYKNNGSGAFTFSGNANGYSGNQFFYDWNKDGFLDIITMDDYNGYGLRWKQNDGSGNFAAGVQLLSTSIYGITYGKGFFADMNGDGLVDVVYGASDVNGDRGYVQVFYNTGCGFPSTPSIYSTQQSNSTSIGILKMNANNDGKADVFISTRGEISKTIINNIATALPPTLSTITGVTNASRCGNGIVTLTASANNGGTISWWDAASGGSLVTTGSSLPTVVNTGTPTQSFWVDATLNGCTSSRVKVVGIYKGESTSSTSNVTICPAQLPYAWNGLTFTTSGTQTKIGLVNSNGCDSSATLTVTVENAVTPSIVINTASASVCNNMDVSFTASATNGGASPNYQWKKNGIDVGSGSSITFLAGTLSTGDNIGCVLTANNACQTTATAGSNKIEITVKPSSSITSILTGTGANISNSTLCTLGTTTRYYNATPYGTWSTSNTSIASVDYTGTVTANSNGNASLYYTITAANGCRSTAIVALNVAAQTIPSSITGANSVCAGATSILNSATPSGIWSCAQTSQATINANTGSLLSKSAGSIIVNYTVTNASGCSAVTSKNIIVNALPAVPLIAYAAGTNTTAIRNGNDFCNGKTFGVVGNPAGGSWNYTNPLVGTISGGGAVSLIGVGNGAIVYTYTNANGCKNSRTMPGNVVNCPGSRSIINEQLAISSDFAMYPNPARTFISLNVNTLIGAGSIVVTDLYGKVVKTQPLSMGTNTINISSLAKGMYLVSVITSEGKTTKKLVVE